MSQAAPADDLISIPEAARRVGLHPETVYRLCRLGQFPPAIHIGARWRVSVPRLERYLHADAREAPDSDCQREPSALSRPRKVISRAI